MAESSTLLMCYTRKGIEGSNPSASAKFLNAARVFGKSAENKAAGKFPSPQNEKPANSWFFNHVCLLQIQYYNSDT